VGFPLTRVDVVDASASTIWILAKGFGFYWRETRGTHSNPECLRQTLDGVLELLVLVVGDRACGVLSAFASPTFLLNIVTSRRALGPVC
jgi:hypothetical protein